MTFFQKNKLLIAVLSVVIFVFGIILTLPTAFAGGFNPDSAYQEIDTGSVNLGEGSWRGQGVVSSTGNIFVNQVWKLKIKADFDGVFMVNYYGPVAKICAFNNDGSIAFGDCSSVSRAGNYYTIDYGPAFQPAGDVWFQLKAVAGAVKLYGATTDNYTYGALCCGGNSPYIDECILTDPILDMYFVLSETAELGVIHNDEIEITAPVFEAPGDFENWEITFDTEITTTATTTGAYVAYIYAGYTPDPGLQILSGSAGSSIVHSFESPKLIENNGVYGEGQLHAHAKLYYQPDRFYHPEIIQQVATSSVINFTITPTSYALSFYPMPISEATSSEWTFTCDPDSGFFANSLCNMFRFVFVPTTASVNRFGDLGDTIKSKPPFGYWTEIKNEIQGINATGPAFVLTGASVLAENTIFVNIRTMTSILLWFLFGFWILHRIRKFNF